MLIRFVIVTLSLLLHPHAVSVFGWNTVDTSGPREIRRIVHEKVKDGTITPEQKPDKFFFAHSYHQMYGTYLLPYVKLKHELKKPVKLFEIGLGCYQGDIYFHGLVVWREIFNISGGDEIIMAELDGDCVDKIRQKGKFLDGVKTVIGDQGDDATLKKWISETEGKFDIVIDDGAHLNTRIYNSFMKLWPEVKPGGLYFIEDLQVTRNTGDFLPDDSGGKYIMPDVIRDWMDQLMVPLHKGEMRNNLKHRLPPGIKWIGCQMEACVIQKCEKNDIARCSSSHH